MLDVCLSSIQQLVVADDLFGEVDIGLEERRGAAADR